MTTSPGAALRRLAVFSSLLLASCSLDTGPRPVTDGSAGTRDVIALGANALGEACRLAEDRNAARAAGERHFIIQCGDWSTPSARIVQTGVARAPGPGSPLWDRELASRLTCDTAEATEILGGQPARLHRCRLRRGGWPMLGLTAEIRGTGLLVQTIPSGLVVAERAVGSLTGLGAGDEDGTRGSMSRAIQQIELGLRDQLFSAGDIRAYEELLDVAQYYNSVGNFVASERFYRDALTILRKVVPPDDPVLADPLVRLALALSNQGKVTEAEALFDTLEPLSLSTYDPLTAPRFLVARASHKANRRQCVAALEDLEGGQAQLIQIANSDDGLDGRILAGGADAAAVELALSGALEGAIRLCLDDLDAADRAVDRAISILADNTQAPPDWRPSFLSLRAEIRRRRESPDGGEADLERALTARRALFDRSRPEALDNLYLGQLHAEAGRTQDAFANFRTGVAVLRETNEGVLLDQVLPFLRLLREEARRDPARAAALHGEMFDVGQIVRDSVTSRTIAATAARLASADQAVSTVIRDLQEARRRIGDLNQAIDAAQSRPDASARETEIAAMIAERDAARREAGDLEGEVQAAAPAYNQLVSRPQDLAAAQASLRDDEAILQVLVGTTSSVAFLVTPTRVTPHFVGFGTEEAAYAVDRLRAGLTIGPDQRLAAFDLKLAHGLYAAIAGPFADQLAGVDHLITVPSGPLASLPFAVLVRSRPTRDPRVAGPVIYAETDWLGQAHAISLAPSVRAFTDLRSLRAAGTGSRAMIGFGDFQVAEDAPDVVITPACESRVQWMARNAPLLPDTRAELETVAAALGVPARDLSLGWSFTEDSVRAAPLDQYRIVYFATHGLMPADVGCRTEPALVTSGFDPGDPTRDGLLTSTEVLDLRLDADLVVLSACNTGGGDGSGGESLSGLARSFFYAGARGLLVSHWYVESAATQRLMSDLFARLSRDGGLGSAEALRQAQTRIVETAIARGDRFGTHPAFWGAFTVVGDGARSVRVN